MWALLSTRLRTWLFVVLVLPLVGRVLEAGRARAARSPGPGSACATADAAAADGAADGRARGGVRHRTGTLNITDTGRQHARATVREEESSWTGR
jgi:hypothetical protein